MSAKDAFFKKVQENNNAQETHVERAKTDIEKFRTSMATLAQQIESWLKGSGVEVSVTEDRHHDESIGHVLGSGYNLGQYQIVSVRLKNNTKTGMIKPDAVYGYGAAGRATLTLENPDRAPRTAKYFLILSKDDHSWSIRPENQPPAQPGQPRQSYPLTEENFFKVIETLA